jgi:transposase-like protein
METITPIKWRHFPVESIFLCVRCSLRYALSSPDVEEMMHKRCVHGEHTMI